MPSAPASPSASPRLTFAMAAAAGLAVANLYYNQPMLGLMTTELGDVVGLVPAATQLGYALGLVLLVPLGDVRDRKRLVLVQVVGLFASLGIAAVAPGAAVLVAASLAIGVMATIAQQIVPFAAELAAPEERGRVVGTVMSGLLAGILLARTLSGVVARFLGWRAMFGVGAGLAVLTGLLLAAMLPESRPTTTSPYPALLRSLVDLLRRHERLRRAVLVQGGLFAAFSVFWSTLALYLADRFAMGSEVAGLFGVIGLAGVLVAPLAGRGADRRGPYGIIGAGVVLGLLSFVVLGLWRTIAGLVVGVILLDAGVQMAMIPHQTVIFALEPAARSRINTVYMTGMFLAGAAGSALASVAWHAWGWTGVTALGGACAAASLGVHAVGRIREGRPGSGSRPTSPEG